MARRTNKPVETEATAEVTESTESTDSAQADSTEQPEGTESTSAEIDLSGFQSAVEQALEDADADTGHLPATATESVTAEYRKLDGQKARNRAKALVDEGIRDSIIAGNLPQARSYTLLRDALNQAVASKAAAPKEPVDPTVAFSQKLAALTLAQSITLQSVPEGVDSDKAQAEASNLVESLTEQVTSYQAWLDNEAEDKGDAPDVSAVVKSAFKLAAGKSSVGGRGGSSTPFTGTRGDVAKHIREAFVDKPVGHFLKISEISNFKSSEYGDRQPSQGAVSARLFQGSGVPGIESVQKNEAEGTPRGARKAEEFDAA